MNYKVEGAIKNNKKTFIICIVLWMFIVIVLVPPFAYSLLAATYQGGFDLNGFLEMLFKIGLHPFLAFKGLAINSRNECIF